MNPVCRNGSRSCGASRHWDASAISAWSECGIASLETSAIQISHCRSTRCYHSSIVRCRVRLITIVIASVMTNVTIPRMIPPTTVEPRERSSSNESMIIQTTNAITPAMAELRILSVFTELTSSFVAQEDLRYKLPYHLVDTCDTFLHDSCQFHWNPTTIPLSRILPSPLTLPIA